MSRRLLFIKQDHVSPTGPVGEAFSNGYQVALPSPVQGRCNPVTTTPSTCAVPAVVEPH